MTRLHGPRAARGQAAFDYLLLVLLVAVAIGIGRSSEIHALLAAVVAQHERYTYAVSLP